MKTSEAVALGTFAALSAAAAGWGAGVVTASPKKLWYRLLRKPPQTPPDRVFGLVWPVLYAMSAYSGYRAWKQRATRGSRVTLGL